MAAIKRFLRKIGIVTLRDHESEMEEFRFKCEEFAKNYLDASRGLTIGAEPGFIKGGELREGGAVIGSRMLLDGVRFKHLVVAPWADQVVVSRGIATGAGAPKSVRAVVRAKRSDETPCNSSVGISQ